MSMRKVAAPTDTEREDSEREPSRRKLSVHQAACRKPISKPGKEIVWLGAHATCEERLWRCGRAQTESGRGARRRRRLDDDGLVRESRAVLPEFFTAGSQRTARHLQSPFTNVNSCRPSLHFADTSRDVSRINFAHPSQRQNKSTPVDTPPRRRADPCRENCAVLHRSEGTRGRIQIQLRTALPTSSGASCAQERVDRLKSQTESLAFPPFTQKRSLPHWIEQANVTAGARGQCRAHRTACCVGSRAISSNVGAGITARNLLSHHVTHTGRPLRYRTTFIGASLRPADRSDTCSSLTRFGSEQNWREHWVLRRGALTRREVRGRREQE
eukprot:651624-Pleurochrysis_carterae.AAC.2